MPSMPNVLATQSLEVSLGILTPTAGKSGDPSDAATYLTHILEDVVKRISAGARDMGGSFGQRVLQAFLPDHRVELPEGFEAGDRPLELVGFIAGGDVQPPLLHPPILPSESELSRFPSTYHFGGEVHAHLEEKYPGGLAYRHADGRVTGPLVAGGFDTSEDDSVREDNSAREDDTAGEVPPWPHSDVSHPAARCGRPRSSLPLIDEESRDMTPPSSSVAFMSVPTMPSNSSQTSFTSLGSTETFGGPRFVAASFETTPTPQAGGSLLVGSSVGRFSALDTTPLVLSTVQRASSPGCTASVDEGSAGSFRELETRDANDVNGASGGSIESGGAVAGSLAGAGVEDVDME
ncbi:hypothetical protein B0H14DRAFT_2623193 [Mycena olivaceomarginata]|nr:hypothetical protein B0H14DRAFT_2623193 [Mycena olivaceomarginata]